MHRKKLISVIIAAMMAAAVFVPQGTAFAAGTGSTQKTDGIVQQENEQGSAVSGSKSAGAGSAAAYKAEADKSGSGDADSKAGTDTNSGSEADDAADAEPAALTTEDDAAAAAEEAETEEPAITPDTSWYSDGTSSFTLKTAEELAGLAKLVNEGNTFEGKTVELANDIALTGTWTPIGSSKNVFAGTFDGNSYKVTGLSISDITGGYKGLFGNSTGTLRNVTVEGSIGTEDEPVTFTPAAKDGDNDCIGGLTGRNNGTVTGITGNVSIYVVNTKVLKTGNIYCVGGIVGFNDKNGTVSKCFNSGHITGTKVFGGIVGRNYNKVDRCVNKGRIQGSNGEKDGAGGIVGISGDKNCSYETSVTNCYNFGTISNTGTTQVGRWHGGIVGMADATVTITNCYDIGTIVEGYSWNWNPIIGHVDYYYSTVHDNYSLKGLKAGDSNASTQKNTIGIVKTEEEFQSASMIDLLGSAYTMDTDEINDGYPVLDWQSRSITEEQLYGEYAGKLSNKSYKNMYSEICGQIDDILQSSAGDDSWLSSFKACLEDGSQSNLKSVLKKSSGKSCDEKTLEDALALAVLTAASEDSGISDDVMENVKTTYNVGRGTSDEVRDVIRYDGLTNAADKVKVAEQLSGGLFTKSDILVLIESAEQAQENEKTSGDTFSGTSVNAASLAINTALTMEAEHEIITTLMQYVDQNTPLYKGLSRIDKKLQNVDADEIVPAMLEYGLSNYGDSLPDSSSDTAYIAPAGFGANTVKALISVPELDGVSNTAVAYANAAQMNKTADNLISKISTAYQDGDTAGAALLNEDYEMIYRTYLASLDSSVQNALNIASDNQKTKLQSIYDRLSPSLTFTKYTESCLANANTEWKYYVKDGKAVITGYLPAAERSGCSLDIPDTIDGYSVSTVSEAVLEENSYIKCVTIPDSVSVIGNSAFASCTKLDTVYLGSGLTTINRSAFEDCSALSLVNIPYSVKTIGTDAFAGTDNLVIQAQAGTAAETYAENNSLTFESVDGEAVSISITAAPSKTSYTMSEAIDTAGMVVKAKYENGTEKDVTKYCSSAFVNKAPGTVTVKVSYKGLAASYNVQVSADECRYTVRYENECGDEIADKTTAKGTAGTAVTLTAPEIKGYTADSQELTKTIGADSEFVITYTSNAKTDISETEISYEKEQKYTGKQITPEVTVTYEGKELTEGKDYYVDYDKNTSSGKGGIMICGIGSYCGDMWLEFTIEDGSFFNGQDTVRIYGDNRYGTSKAAANALKQSLNTDKFESIIVASGLNYPDALAGSYLAKVKNGPVMLVGTDTKTEADLRTYISNNLKAGGTVYLLGGTGVVTTRFESSLKKLKISSESINVERLGGSTRYDTNIEILKAAGVYNEDLLICTGENFADSLSASAVGKPILIVAKSGLNANQIKYLDTLKPNEIYLIGGSDVVSSSVDKQLKSYDRTHQCERIEGQTRYETSVAIAEKFFEVKAGSSTGSGFVIGSTDTGGGSVVLARAQDYPDGLTGGPLAISINSPLILVENNSYSAAVSYAKSANIKKVAVLGGPALISDSVVKKIKQ